jgi:hypothetical protein
VPDQHGEALMSICGHGDTADRIKNAEGDFAVVDERGKVRQ